MRCLLGSMVACLLVPCISRERSRDMVHYNCLDSQTAGLKQTTAFCMMPHLYHGLYRGGLGWFCGLASELERAHSGAVHPCFSPMAGPLVTVTGHSTSPYRRPLHIKQRVVLEKFVMVGDGKGSQFMRLLRNALHLTLQARCHHCPGCQFDLKQVGFTATYRPRQCLLKSRNTFFPIFRAGILEPHWSESCIWHNGDVVNVVTQRPECLQQNTHNEKTGRK
jgi:hypothetical protein